MNINNARAFEKWYNANYGNKSLFGSIALRTYPKLLKKDRLTGQPADFKTGEIVKISASTIGINYDYHTSKANKLGQSKDNTIVQKPWGTHHVSKLILQKDTDVNQYYMSVQFNTANKPEVSYFYKGQEIDKADIGDILPVSGKSALPPVRSPKVESIKELSIGDYNFSS